MGFDKRENLYENLKNTATGQIVLICAVSMKVRSLEVSNCIAGSNPWLLDDGLYSRSIREETDSDWRLCDTHSHLLCAWFRMERPHQDPFAGAVCFGSVLLQFW